jgi:hypothetical protein
MTTTNYSLHAPTGPPDDRPVFPLGPGGQYPPGFQPVIPPVIPHIIPVIPHMTPEYHHPVIPPTPSGFGYQQPVIPDLGRRPGTPRPHPEHFIPPSPSSSSSQEHVTYIPPRLGPGNGAPIVIYHLWDLSSYPCQPDQLSFMSVQAEAAAQGQAAPSTFITCHLMMAPHITILPHPLLWRLWTVSQVRREQSNPRSLLIVRLL